MRRYIDDFPSLLGRIELETMENQGNPILGLSEDLTMIYFNPAWIDFFKENEGTFPLPENMIIGASILNSIHGPEQKLYQTLYRMVLKNGEPLEHDYECSSPKLYRLYRQKLLPLESGKGLLIENSLRIEKSMEETGRVSFPYKEGIYLQQDGFLHQCSNCRRTKRNDHSRVWDWVPSMVEKMPPNVSHTICPICFEYYWKNEALSLD